MEWQKRVSTPVAALVLLLVAFGAWYLVRSSITTGVLTSLGEHTTVVEDTEALGGNGEDDTAPAPSITNTDPTPSAIPSNWKLVVGDSLDLCSGPTFEGEATISGYLTYGGSEISKDWLFSVVDEDQGKLPFESYVDVVTKRSVNALVRLDDIPSNLVETVRLATADDPATITVQGYSMYCEGSPTVRFEPFPPLEDALETGASTESNGE